MYSAPRRINSSVRRSICSKGKAPVPKSRSIRWRDDDELRWRKFDRTLGGQSSSHVGDDHLADFRGGFEDVVAAVFDDDVRAPTEPGGDVLRALRIRSAIKRAADEQRRHVRAPRAAKVIAQVEPKGAREMGHREVQRVAEQ